MRVSGPIAALFASLALGGCAKLTLAWANLDPHGAPASPLALGESANPGPITTVEAWESERAPELRAELEREVYGVMPDASSARTVSHKTLNEAAFNGKGRLEEYRIEARVTFNGVTVTAGGTEEGSSESGFLMNVVLPTNASGPVPVILIESFCPRWDTLPDPAITRKEGAWSCEEGGFMTSVMHYAFGRYIATPPVEAILDRGYAIATIFPSEVVPDSKKKGLEELKRLAAGHEDQKTRWGAIAAWGWAFSRMVDVLEGDPRFDANAMIVWGHSRYGKAALVAAAFDNRIDGVIAHQSGTGGASLNREKIGESLKEITSQYPHWFDENYAAYAGHEEEMTVDQHMLLALIAPRPVLLGNARRDVWSDPNGAFRAALGADPVYELYGSRGLDQARLVPYRPQSDIAFWIRPGTHGVVQEDWPAFLEFLDAHFKHERAAMN